MRYLSCHSENPENTRFCIECGAAFERRCLRCGFENLPQAKFCGLCGAALTESEAPQTSGGSTTNAGASGDDALNNRSRHDGERRHLTVLFCDLVGSTAIAAQLDPEEWRETVADYHRAATDAIERFSGYVAQYLGDGVMSLFGWPEAHDNDGERAVRAGLAILDAIAKLNEQPRHVKLSARVGIDSGTVVIGKGAGKEADVFGDAPNIAARVQAAAEPGTVAISDGTHRLVSGLFLVEDRGAQALKGIERPTHLYRVTQPSGARGRLDAVAAARGLTPFVGREDELRLLLSRWDRVLEGAGQVALIMGEAGIGKSRLVQRFRERIAATPHNWVAASTSPFSQNTPFHPIAGMLRELLELGGEISAEKQLSRLAEALELAELKPAEVVPLIAQLMNLPLPPNLPALTLSAERQRRQLLATLVALVLAMARAQPLVIATEDLHWADPSTLELIHLLVEEGATSRLLLLYTARPEFRPEWPLRAHHAHLVLSRLSDRQAREMIEKVASQKDLSRETVETVVRRATGVPLFVEELTRDLLERGEHPTQNQIPPTLRDSLMARLDRLGSARELAQIGATIGREFSYRLLNMVAGVSECDLDVALDKLVGADLLYARGSPPEASYVFKHALVQDAAYSTLLKTRRRELHQRVAHILQGQFPDTAVSAPELLAYHCTEAGLVAEAVHYWRKAGRKAVERTANVEAIAQLGKGLDLIKHLPVTSKRLMEEVKLQVTLLTPLIATKGYTAPEVEKACTRALELCQQLGEVPQLFTVLGGLNSIYFNRGEFEISLELAKRMLRLAQSRRDPVLLVWGHYALGFTLASQGVSRSARNQLEQSIAFYDVRKGGTYGFVQDPGPTALALLSHVVHALGYPDQALKKMQQALTLARNLSHPFTLAWVLGLAGELNWKRGEKLAAQELWEERVELCSQQDFRPLLASASLRLAFAMVEQGKEQEKIAVMQDALNGTMEAWTVGDRLLGLNLLGLAQGKVGQADQGIAKIDEALVLASKSKKSGHAGDLYLAKGQLFLMKDARAARKAQQCFRAAIGIARKQYAKSEELAAALHLARLLASRGRRDDARTILGDIYNWFTEGFDTADLKDAKALLDELAG
jgi:class 3 adenylate cyclase/tetratricopeptide (TPR) repeat protein